MKKEIIDLNELETEKEHLSAIVLSAVSYFEKKTGFVPNINIISEIYQTKCETHTNIRVDISVTI